MPMKILLTVVNLIAVQNTLNPLLDMDDPLEVKKDVIFQDRLIERLSSLVQSTEQNILTMLSEMQNPPFVQLLKGICPKMLMQEPSNDGLKFRCHASGINECLCFSHKKATWYKAEAFCRQFRMTLADVPTDKVEWIKHKVNNPSAVDGKGEWYWTSATDRFARGQMIWMNTGQLYQNPNSNSDATSLCVIVGPITPVSAESTSFLQEIESLEDEYFALIETISKEDDINDILIHGTCPKHFTAKKFRCLKINGECYCIVSEDKNWWSALHYCRQYGMELLSLETKEEENNLAKQLKAEKTNGDHGNALYKLKNNYT
ncbi:hypothetical protein DAPPUDRAFT_260992 [Daphnia pulex]|uniref:C-type lectin domain-containing protein n=1 Tax=Daphnia pulex TaxID=6669 RepID=E9HKB4_DAPPU|nr:hypothetical protein DAPPUDRAFT_260992 [Daphnia pulex]|eukprot:EFX67863.1 hypothetical protein DAPPUDRAFT_260992 [Daphnia pulex]